MYPLERLQRAWRLYQTDNRGDTVAAVVLVGAVAYPVGRLWWTMRKE